MEDLPAEELDRLQEELREAREREEREGRGVQEAHPAGDVAEAADEGRGQRRGGGRTPT